jgi:hypothetical protein
MLINSLRQAQPGTLSVSFTHSIEQTTIRLLPPPAAARTAAGTRAMLPGKWTHRKGVAHKGGRRPEVQWSHRKDVARKGGGSPLSYTCKMALARSPNPQVTPPCPPLFSQNFIKFWC